MESSTLIQRMLAIRSKLKRRKTRAAHGDTFVAPSSGSGFEFSTIREYQEGDDIRRIDWSSSARSGNLMTRIYQEQKQRNIMILCDTSPSMHITSQERTPWEIAQDIAVVCGSAAHAWNDGFGCAVVDAELQCTSFHIPKRGLPHIMRALAPVQTGENTATKHPLIHALSRVPRGTVLIYITDGLFPHAQIVPLMRARGPLLYIRTMDPVRVHAPSQGTITYHDPETHGMHWYAPQKDRASLQRSLDHWNTEQNMFLRSQNIDRLDIPLEASSYDDLLCDFLVQHI